MLPRSAFARRVQNSHRADLKPCDNCGTEFARPHGISEAQWANRRYCTPSCSSQRPIRARLADHSETNEAGCLIWTGPLNRDGYGRFIVQRDGVKVHLAAHRASFEAFCRPIPPGMIVMHTCDVPACINPLHLKLGTHADNMADKVAKGRHRSPDRDQNGMTKLNSAAVEVVRNSTLPNTVLAQAFGVSASTIKRARNA